MKIEIHPQYEHLRTFVEHLPDCFDREGELLFRGRNTIKAFTVADAQGETMTLVVKRYKRPNFVQKIAYSFFCDTKAKRAYEHAHVLGRRGFLTPTPYAYVETRRRGLVDYCYFVSDVDRAHPIAERLNDVEAFDKTLATDFAHFAARLHEKGIIDVDLNSTNVLFHPREDGHYCFSLIDINRMKVYAEGTRPPRTVCMENLTRFTGRMDLFAYVAAAYVEARQWPHRAVETLVATKRRHDQRWRRRKRFLHCLKHRK